MLIEEVKEHIIARRKQNPGMEPVKLDGMNLLYEADWLSRGLRYDYLWFKYLREVVGVYLTPDEQGEVSFFCPPELRSPIWERYEKAFIEWRDNVLFAPDGSVEGKWFNNDKGILLVTLLVGLGMYGIGIDTIARNNGPINKVNFKRGESLLEVLEWLAGQLETMDEYIGKGWYPGIQLPVIISPRGDRVAYDPGDTSVGRGFFDPRDFGICK